MMSILATELEQFDLRGFMGGWRLAWPVEREEGRLWRPQSSTPPNQIKEWSSDEIVIDW
jgi:hypothetical protein